MPETPGRTFPVVSESAIIRMRLGLIIAAIGAIVTGTIGGTLYLNNEHNANVRREEGLNELKEWARSFDRRLGNVEDALGVVPDRAVFGPVNSRRNTP